jgi:chromosome segregation ATPase
MSKPGISRFGLILMLLVVGCSLAVAADPEAIRRQQEHLRQQALQQERDRLDQQIRIGQQQLDQAKKQAEQVRKTLPNLKKQYEEANRQAEQFKPEVQNQQQHVDEARSQQKAAMDRLREARNQLNEIADRIEKEQPKDAPIFRAKVGMQQAQQNYDVALKRVLESAEYKEAFQAAQDTGSATKVAEARSAFLSGDAKLSALQLELKTSRDAYEEQRKKIVVGHPDYQSADEAVKRAQAEATEAGKQLDQAIRKHGQAKAALAEKIASARKAAALGTQATANLKLLEQAQPRMLQQIKQWQDRRRNLR